MKKIVVLLLTMILSLVLCSCACIQHDWISATCTSPQKCRKCGKTEGVAMGHHWNAANCVNPQKCSRCGITKGNPSGVHSTKYGKCKYCGKFIKELSSEWSTLIEVKNNTAQAIMRAGQAINIAGNLSRAIDEINLFYSELERAYSVFNSNPNDFISMRKSFDTLLASYREFVKSYNAATSKSQRETCVLAMCQTYTNWGWDSFNVALKDYTQN